MSPQPYRRPTPRAWRSFPPREGRRIEREIGSAADPRCPCCRALLEARPSRLAGRLPLDATGYDLECRGCRRFWCVVRHTARSLRLVRMRRFVAAVRAVEPATRRESASSVPIAAA